MKEVRIPVTSMAAVIGLALIGNGVDGSTGAGVALLGSVAVGFLLAWVASGTGVGARRKTLRHRWFLLVDWWQRRRTARRREQDRQKKAELAYLRARTLRRRGENFPPSGP